MNKDNKNLNRMTGAFILILILIIVIVQRTNLTWVKNWWGLLFLIPAIGSINNVFSETSHKRNFSFSLASNIMGIVFPIVLCVIILFGLNWQTILPIVIILAGMALFILGFVNDNKGGARIIQHLRFWFFSWGLAVIMVGIIMFVTPTPTNTNPLRINDWYATALLVSSFGGLVSGINHYRLTKSFSWLSILHIVIGIGIAIPPILVLFS